MNKILQKYGESIIRIFFLTLIMTGIVTYWKLGYDANYFINWMKTWAMVALIAYIFMCFIIRPFILEKFKLEGKKRHLAGMFLLITLFTFIFSYRFDWLNLHNIDIIILVKNFLTLTAIVLPVWMWIAGPLAKVLAKKFIK